LNTVVIVTCHLTHKNPSLMWPIMCLVGR